MSQKQIYQTTSIPESLELDWNKIYNIKIEESGEELVPVSLYPEKILVRSIYYQQGYSQAVPEIFLRKGVYEHLVKASKSLPEGYKLVIYDGWRPVELQKSLFDNYIKQLSLLYPEKSKDELKKTATNYVAFPSANRTSPSPHSTGASVDLTIADEKGQLLYMGGEFDETTSRSETCHYELSENTQGAKENRRLLYHIMAEAGFTNFPEEWWHFDYGNQNWIYFSGKSESNIKARYGYVESENLPIQIKSNFMG